MLRVAAVAKVICDNWIWEDFDKEATMTSCFLHDMGNILKFNLDLYPDFFQPEWVDYWKWIKEQYKQYWSNDWEATLSLAYSLGISKTAMKVLYAQVMLPFQSNVEGNNIAIKICEFADMSVSPHWIISWRERILDLEKRNMKNHAMSLEKAQEVTQRRLMLMAKLENELEKNCPVIGEICWLANDFDLDSLRNYLI